MDGPGPNKQMSGQVHEAPYFGANADPRSRRRAPTVSVKVQRRPRAESLTYTECEP